MENKEGQKERKQKYAELVKREYENGNIVIVTTEGTQTLPLSEFLNQPVDGMLYDLNRGEETILMFIDDVKWVNDYAATKVLRALHSKVVPPTESKQGEEQEKLWGEFFKGMDDLWIRCQLWDSEKRKELISKYELKRKP